MELLGYIAAILMGLSLGLIGGGGSILTVPILVYLFSVNPIIATSYSLFIVGATALFGSYLAYRKNEINLRMAFRFAVPSFIGVYTVKMIVLPLIPEDILSIQNFLLTKTVLVMGVFALLMVVASLAMINRKIRSEQEPNDLKVTIQGFFVGSVTGFVGAGGGFLIVPALVNLLGLNMRSAIGTSLTIISLNSLFGFGLSMYQGLQVNWLLLFCILSVALIGLVIGFYYSNKISDMRLKKGFGYFVLIVGTIILIDQITKT